MKKFLLFLFLTGSVCLLGLGGCQLFQYWDESRQSNEVYSGLMSMCSVRIQPRILIYILCRLLMMRMPPYSFRILILNPFKKSIRMLSGGFIARVLLLTILLSKEKIIRII